MSRKAKVEKKEDQDLCFTSRAGMVNFKYVSISQKKNQIQRDGFVQQV